MNLLLLTSDDFRVGADDFRVGAGIALVRDDRHRHLVKVLRVAVGDELRVGMLGGRVGRAVVVAIAERSAELRVTLDQEPPPALGATLVLALPRPKFLGRILQCVAAMGVKRLVLTAAERVEKSFWQSSVVAPESVRRHLMLGLAQARDTVLPRVDMVGRFRDLVETTLPVLLSESRGWVAHGDGARALPAEVATPATLIVGPEGGFLDSEVERMVAAGAEAVTLGPRPLKVETAVAVMLGRVALG